MVILVVDDDDTIRLMCRRVLERRGHEVFEAAGGKAGLALCRSFRPDIVLLDGLMPDMDGFSCCRALLQLIPDLTVVMVTGLTEADTAAQIKAAGAVDYVTKPIDWPQLLETIQRYQRSAPVN